MTDEHIHVAVAPGVERYEDEMNVNADVDVDVQGSLGPSAIIGLICLALGILSIVVTSIFFIAGFPDTWYEIDATFEEARQLAEMTTLGWAAGGILILLGTSLYFFGRTVVGSGRMEQYKVHEALEVSRD